MPAILRNSLPNLYPLIAIIRPYAQNDVVGVRRAGLATVSKVGTACGSATLCLAFGVCGFTFF